MPLLPPRSSSKLSRRSEARGTRQPRHLMARHHMTGRLKHGQPRNVECDPKAEAALVRLVPVPVLVPVPALVLVPVLLPVLLLLLALQRLPW